MWEKISDCMSKSRVHSVVAQGNYILMPFVLIVTKPARLMSRLVSNQSRLTAMNA